MLNFLDFITVLLFTLASLGNFLEANEKLNLKTFLFWGVLLFICLDFLIFNYKWINLIYFIYDQEYFVHYQLNLYKFNKYGDTLVIGRIDYDRTEMRLEYNVIWHEKLSLYYKWEFFFSHFFTVSDCDKYLTGSNFTVATPIVI